MRLVADNGMAAKGGNTATADVQLNRPKITDMHPIRIRRHVVPHHHKRNGVERACVSTV